MDMFWTKLVFFGVLNIDPIYNHGIFLHKFLFIYWLFNKYIFFLKAIFKIILKIYSKALFLINKILN